MDPKEFEWLPATNDLIIEATEALFENDGTVEKGICIITPHGNIALTKSELERILKEIETLKKLKQREDMSNQIKQKGWAIVGEYGLYTGWWFTRKDAIADHCKAKGWTWKECRKSGDRAIKILISES